jgi:hypothetical protein
MVDVYILHREVESTENLWMFAMKAHNQNNSTIICSRDETGNIPTVTRQSSFFEGIFAVYEIIATFSESSTDPLLRLSNSVCGKDNKTWAFNMLLELKEAGMISDDVCGRWTEKVRAYNLLAMADRSTTSPSIGPPPAAQSLLAAFHRAPPSGRIRLPPVRISAAEQARANLTEQDIQSLRGFQALMVRDGLLARDMSISEASPLPAAQPPAIWPTVTRLLETRPTATDALLRSQLEARPSATYPIRERFSPAHQSTARSSATYPIRERLSPAYQLTARPSATYPFRELFSPAHQSTARSSAPAPSTLYLTAAGSPVAQPSALHPPTVSRPPTDGQSKRARSASGRFQSTPRAGSRKTSRSTSAHSQGSDQSSSSIGNAFPSSTIPPKKVRSSPTGATRQPCARNSA